MPLDLEKRIIEIKPLPEHKREQLIHLYRMFSHPNPHPQGAQVKLKAEVQFNHILQDLKRNNYDTTMIDILYDNWLHPLKKEVRKVFYPTKD